MIQLDDYAEFQHAIDVFFDVEKIGRNIFVNLELKTKLALVCDRCLEAFNQDFDENIKLIYTFDKEFKNSEDQDVYVISDSTNVIDVTEPVRQTLLVSLPYKRTCDKLCKGLCSQCGINLNKGECDCKLVMTNPEWDKLKKLL